MLAHTVQRRKLLQELMGSFQTRQSVLDSFDKRLIAILMSSS